MGGWIPWVDAIYNTMGGWITWVDEYHELMPFSIRINHASRKPSSIVKSALDPQNTKSLTTRSTGPLTNSYPWLVNHIFIKHSDPNPLQTGGNQSVSPANVTDGWAPFNGTEQRSFSLCMWKTEWNSIPTIHSIKHVCLPASTSTKIKCSTGGTTWDIIVIR